jgi:hypothetical protein
MKGPERLDWMALIGERGRDGLTAGGSCMEAVRTEVSMAQRACRGL